MSTEQYSQIWNNNRSKLKEIGFALEVSAVEAKVQQKSLHSKYTQLFFDLPITQVTAFLGHKEWHLTHQFSLSSKHTYSLICILCKHYLDLEHEYLQ